MEKYDRIIADLGQRYMALKNGFRRSQYEIFAEIVVVAEEMSADGADAQLHALFRKQLPASADCRFRSTLRLLLRRVRGGNSDTVRKDVSRAAIALSSLRSMGVSLAEFPNEIEKRGGILRLARDAASSDARCNDTERTSDTKRPLGVKPKRARAITSPRVRGERSGITTHGERAPLNALSVRCRSEAVARRIEAMTSTKTAIVRISRDADGELFLSVLPSECDDRIELILADVHFERRVLKLATAIVNELNSS